MANGVVHALLVGVLLSTSWLPANAAAEHLSFPTAPPAVASPAAASPAAVSASSLLASASSAAATSAPSRDYLFVTGFPFPLGPFTERKTVQTELVKGRVYGFEQEIRLSGISANVRSTVFRTRDNHLVVYNPVGPTDEFLQQLAGLNHDGVSHILLGATQYEHKVFVGPFARKFPDAHVWAVPDQWSFPLDLPARFFGIDTAGSGGGELVDTASGSKAYAAAPDLTSEFEVKLLRPSKRLGFGYAANEAAVLHRDTKTLALTDALVNVPARPTSLYDEAILRTIGDNAPSTNSLGNIILRGTAAVNWRGTGAQAVSELFSPGTDRQGTSAEQLQRGWERNVLLSLFFGPSPETIIAPADSFDRLKDRWIVAPVTSSLIYRSDRVQPELARWVDDVAKWDFEMISPSHFAARAGTADDLRAAFAPTLAAAKGDGSDPKASRPYMADDVRLLDDLADGLVKVKII